MCIHHSMVRALLCAASRALGFWFRNGDPTGRARGEWEELGATRDEDCSTGTRGDVLSVVERARFAPLH